MANDKIPQGEVAKFETIDADLPDHFSAQVEENIKKANERDALKNSKPVAPGANLSPAVQKQLEANPKLNDDLRNMAKPDLSLSGHIQNGTTVPAPSSRDGFAGAKVDGQVVSK